MAERLSRNRLAAGGATPDFEVGSAGVRTREGLAMDGHSAEALAELGGSAEGFVSQRLTPELVRGARLVLTMTHDHRSQVLQLAPAALRRTFVLSEAVALGSMTGDHDDLPAPSADRLTALAGLLSAQRARRGAPVADADVADPIGRPLEVHRAVARHIDELLSAFLPLVGAPRPERPARPVGG